VVGEATAFSINAAHGRADRVQRCRNRLEPPGRAGYFFTFGLISVTWVSCVG
jgi:hypothetical protein